MPNKTQALSKSKQAESSLAQYMERLGKISGERKIAGILRWMDVSASSYSNWQRRGTIPYKTLVNVLLERNISLDWFFAPFQKLEIPMLQDQAVEEGAKTYLQQSDSKAQQSQRLIKAYSECQAILNRFGATADEQQMRLMLDLYFSIGARVVAREHVLERLAESLGQLEAEQSPIQTD